MNSDLQQYNSPAGGDFPTTGNVNTNADPYLIPTDGPIVSADNNGLNQAPINVVMRSLRRWLVGLRGAIVGDFAGAVQKTVRSLYADATGGVTHTKTAGTLTAAGNGIGTVAIEAETGDIRSTMGDVLAPLGWLRALSGAEIGTAGEYGRLRAFCTAFVGTTSGPTGANPPSTQAIPNQLRALNTPKAWGSFTTNGMAGAGVIIHDACAITSIVRDVFKFTITFATAFDSANYMAVVTVNGDTAKYYLPIVANKLSGSCEVWIYDIPGATTKDPAFVTAPGMVDIALFGRQTT